MPSAVFRPLVLVCLVVALAVSACGSSDDEAGTTTTEPETTTTAGDIDSRLTTAEVEQLQRELNEVGCFAGTVDGVFGPHTYRGVEEFQKAEGLAEDGEYGPKTEAALTSAAEAGKTVCSTAPDTKPHPPGTAPCTADAITAAAKSVDPEFQTLNGYNCADGYAVADITAGSGAEGVDETVRLQSVNGAWQENDDCNAFPPSLQSQCETN